MEIKDLWDKAIKYIEEKIPDQGFEMWFKPIRFISLSEKEAAMEVPNRFFKEWIEERYTNLIIEALERSSGKKDITLNISLKDKAQSPKRLETDGKGIKAKLNERIIYLNPKYTFDSFVVGLSNQFANAAARAVAERPGSAYNPLFIYGGSGLGKTHLLNAIGYYVIDKRPKMKLSYLPSEIFTNELVTSIRYQRMEEFRNKFRNMDLLLVDDIHFIAGKERTQEEFFHTFNTLYESQKQIVLSSDRFPKDMPEIEERLRSRFEWGLIADIQPPDLETKVAILEKKAETEGIQLPKEGALYIASKVKTNIRELEGCLIRLGAYSSLKKLEITFDMIKEVLRDIIDEKDRPVTIEQIQRIVSQEFGLKLQDIKAKKRSRDIAYPRQIAMYLSRALTNMSLNEIGKAFGGKDHSTVIHATKLIEEKMKREGEVEEKIKSLIKTLKKAEG